MVLGPGSLLTRYLRASQGIVSKAARKVDVRYELDIGRLQGLASTSLLAPRSVARTSVECHRLCVEVS